MSTWHPISRPAFWRRWLPEWSHLPVKIAFQLSLVGLAVFSGIAFFYFMLAMRFDMAEVAKLPAGTTFYDRKGVEISAPGGSGRKLVKRSDIPDFLVKSLRAREDARFFEHSGVDVRGLLRATVRNFKDWDFTQGASTVSMQLARNSFKMKQKSIHRKLLEIALTLRLEANYTKDEILTHYLNRIYFGAGADGIEQAANTYFGKTTSELSDGECALIVGIIRGPHIFSPFRNLDAALEQRSQTLDRLIAMGLIDKKRRDEIAAEPVKLVSEEQRATQTSYALQAVRRELDRVLDSDEIQLGGLHVYTTLDAGWQNRLEVELTRAVEDLEHEKGWTHSTEAAHVPGTEPAYIQYAAVTTETRTGATLALIGGRNYSHSRFDRTRSSRDLGSAFEPFVAAAAAERGKLVLPGKPVLTGRQIGPAEVERLAKRCGIAGPFLKTEDLFRGSVAATPLEMSIGLATLGNKGKRAKPYLIREIRDSVGEVIYTAKPELVQALSPNAASDATSVLARSGGTRCFTGATGSERDAWTLRLGPGGATAIWLGFDKPAAIAREPRLKSLLDEFVQRLGNN
ncbi:penicillin-binding protein [Luteolibacter yonseiensis]|uniref:peptidoglycan glycosyltransferase n=1 Tax=Luteolibacter yonseiensis TaxID=1144680 RepID=A0A934V5Y1_9BACT|nr:transglycosylase domain-containing protein [Luteolibacter yonseiensis]MBK1814432.1 penicillin-binding protein [Luteolibacter yonseiensis]